MAAEVEVYNKHIESMSDGTASPFCYASPEERERRYLVRHQALYRDMEDVTLPSQRGCYEAWDVTLYIEPIEYVPPAWLDGGSSKDEEFFTKPYTDGEGYTLGYIVLPITRVMYSRC